MTYLHYIYLICLQILIYLLLFKGIAYFTFEYVTIESIILFKRALITLTMDMMSM
jgi:hypothetical protein